MNLNMYEYISQLSFREDKDYKSYVKSDSCTRFLVDDDFSLRTIMNRGKSGNNAKWLREIEQAESKKIYIQIN